MKEELFRENDGKFQSNIIVVKWKFMINFHSKTVNRTGCFCRKEMCNTKRCYNAPHNYLTRLVNTNKARILRSMK